MTREELARQRVANSAELSAIEDIIFSDWQNWDEHIEWIISAPVAQIIDWASEMETEEN